MATVADIMERDPVTVMPEDARREGRAHCCASTELPGVPVVNGGGRCVGIVTEADLVLADEEEDLRLPPLHRALRRRRSSSSRVKRFEERLQQGVRRDGRGHDDRRPGHGRARTPTCTRPPRLIAEHRHNRLPVVEHGRLVGVVTRVDVLEALIAEE